MKKVISIFLTISMCLCLSGCKLLELTTEYMAEEIGGILTAVPEAFNEIEEDNKYLDELSAEIVRCFDEKDVEGLKVLFCAEEKNNLELDSQIENAFKLYEGKSQSFYVTDRSWAGGYRDGVYDDKHFTPRIREIITDTGRTYCIGYLVYTVYDYDSGKIGINGIGLKDETGEEIAEIG